MVTAILGSIGVLLSMILSRSLALPVLSSIGIWLLLATQFIFIESDLFGVSVKTLSFLGGLGASLHCLLARVPIQSNGFKNAIYAWILFMICALCAMVVNGSVDTIADFEDFVARYGFSLIVLYLGLIYVRKNNGAFFLALWMFFIAAINFLFALAQVLGFEWATAIHDVVFPKTQALGAYLIETGEITSYGYAPGLSSYSIATGYIFTCLGVIGIGVAYSFKGRLKWGILATTLAIVGGGGLLILSRSTLLVGGVICLLGVLVLGSGEKRKGYQWLLILGMIVAILVNYLSGINDLDTSRLDSLEDSYRSHLRAQALAFIADNFLIGGLKEAVSAGRLDMGAHNFVLNALVYFGVIGALPLFGFVVITFNGLWARRRVKEYFQRRPLVLAGILGMVGYIGKSMAHNESLATSGTTYMWLFVVAAGSAYYPLGEWRFTRISRSARIV